MIANYQKDFHIILFSDESRFSNDPDNRMQWIVSNDFRDKVCAQYSKNKITTMVLGCIGMGFKSKLVFPRGKINENNGRSISHLLSSGRKSIKPTDKIDNGNVPHLLTNQNNITLILENQKKHHKWKQISIDLETVFPIYPTCVKRRVIELERKMNDFKKYPEKYDECPNDIKDLISLFKKIMKISLNGNIHLIIFLIVMKKISMILNLNMIT